MAWEKDYSVDLGPLATQVEHPSGARESACPFACDAAPGALSMVLFHFRESSSWVGMGRWEVVENLLAWLADRECGSPWSVEPLVTVVRGLVEIMVGTGGESDRAKVLLELGRVLHHGETRYGRDNWRGIAPRQHLRHAISHLLGDIAGDRSEGEHGHILRATCRVLLALEVEISEGGKDA